MKRIFLLLAAISVLLQTATLGQIELKVPTIFEELERRKAADPTINAERLAEIANRLAIRQGIEFGFFPGKFRERVRTVGGKRSAYFDLAGVDGKRLSFKSPERSDHPCGTYSTFPVRRITGTTFDLVSGGKAYSARIPKEFETDQITLVDSTLRRPLRLWSVPLDSSPVGISRDGRRIYVESGLDELLLEIDGAGRLRYVAARSPQVISGGVDLTSFPTDKNNDYLGFRRFSSGKNIYTVKFSHPCT